MRPSFRTFTSIFISIIALAAVVWVGTRPSSKPTPVDSTITQTGHLHVDRQVAVQEVDMEPLHDFQSWMSTYRTGERSEAFMKLGRSLVEQRRSTMLTLIKTDAGIALESAIGYADYASLPVEMQALVEEPFTSTGDVEVIAICDHDFHTPEYQVNVYLDDTRFRTAGNSPVRTGLSKLDVPLQGIRLDEWTAIEPTVFEKVEGLDADWAWEELPTGNPDPAVDFFTGEPLGPNPITTVAGGFTFLFSEETSLEVLEAELQHYDNLPGKFTGSSVLFSEEVQEVQAKGFPIQQIRESQNQLSINDTTGDKTSLFIRIVFPDKMDAPISDADLKAQIDGSVSGHLADFSYSQTSMAATVTSKVYTASMNSTEYAYTGQGDNVDEKDLWDEAVAAYQVDVPGDPFASYDIVGIVFPKIAGVGWAGLGTVGGANSKHWLNGTASTETILHEFGHNYGLKHSNYWAFNKNGASTNPVEDEPVGESEEYGDLWDVMGDGDATRGHFHMAAKRYLSWLGENQVERIDSDGTYEKRIYRFDHEAATSGLQGLEIKKSNDENYWIGFRRAFESNKNYHRGAYILWERSATATKTENQGDPTRNQGWIIDTTPESNGERQDAGIALGRTYSDTTAGVHITPVGIGGTAPMEYLDVVVNYGSFAGNNAPQITALNIPSTGEARMPIAFSVDGQDQDGDTLAYSWDLGNGDVYDSKSSVNVSFTVGGTYDVAVTISDMKGGTFTQTAQIAISDPVNNWNTRTSGVSDPITGLASNSTHVIAVGDKTFLRSSDGETWSSHSPPSNDVLNVKLKGATWTGSEFLAVGQDYDFGVPGWFPVVFSSTDGTSWSRVYEGTAKPGGGSNFLSQVASNEDGSLVIAVGWNGQILIRDSEGTWAPLDMGYADNTVLGVAYGNGVFVIGGHIQTGGNQLILMRTPDGVNFEDLVDNSDLDFFAWLDKMAFLDDLFLGSGFFSKILFSENRGISWQTLVQDSWELASFAFGNGVFYGIGEDRDNGKALVNLVSSDGKLWKPVETPQAGNDVHFFNNSFIIVGDGGSILQTDGILAAAETVADPVFSPGSQSFTDSVSVNLSTTTADAQIRYTLDGSDPTEASDIFGSDLVITSTTTVKARAYKSGADPSGIVSATYTKQAEQVADPVITPNGQSFTDMVTVNITVSTQDAQIRYTLDGSDPTEASGIFGSDLVITSTTTVKAKAFKSGATPSGVVSESYTKILSGFDAWIAAYSLTGEDALASANPDGDWASNLLERAVGSLPNDVDSAPDAPELSFDESGRAVFLIHRLSKSGDVDLMVEKSTNLTDWTILATAPTTDSDTMLVLVSSDPVNTFPCFLRIKAVE